MKILLLGPAHPYRGGLVAIMESMAREFMRRGDEVSMVTFTLQYPSFLFPGERQTVDTPAPEDLTIERRVNTINPLNWIAVGRYIANMRPDLVILKYWTPFMAPCFGTIARLARANRHTKFVCQIDNVAPHESRIVDRPFNRYFLSSIDGFIYMSDQVGGELREYTSAPALFSPHPMFENLGSRVEREVACSALGLDPQYSYALFFGLIREYKGLDMLLEAWAATKDRLSGKRLIIAGEFYTDKQPYLELIKRLSLEDNITLHDHFVPDSEVCNYFCASDFLILPYRSATQSGVTQIAYNFSTPMVVTNVGGLPEIVPHDRVGLCCEPNIEGIGEAIATIWSDGRLERYNREITTERERFSWRAMCDAILQVIS
ncbi:MAG: glycosyltransferase family 4 protein [Rikenellaceae bacterium]